MSHLYDLGQNFLSARGGGVTSERYTDHCNEMLTNR